jgi:hypothetical protein
MALSLNLGLRKNRSRCGTGFRHAAFPASSSRRWRRRVEGKTGRLLGFGQRTDDVGTAVGSGGSSRNRTCRPLPPPTFRPHSHHSLTSIHKSCGNLQKGPHPFIHFTTYIIGLCQRTDAHGGLFSFLLCTGSETSLPVAPRRSPLD